MFELLELLERQAVWLSLLLTVLPLYLVAFVLLKWLDAVSARPHPPVILAVKFQEFLED